MYSGEEIILLPFKCSLEFLFDLLNSVELYIIPLVWWDVGISNINLFPHLLDTQTADDSLVFLLTFCLPYGVFEK